MIDLTVNECRLISMSDRYTRVAGRLALSSLDHEDVIGKQKKPEGGYANEDQRLCYLDAWISYLERLADNCIGLPDQDQRACVDQHYQQYCDDIANC